MKSHKDDCQIVWDSIGLDDYEIQFEKNLQTSLDDLLVAKMECEECKLILKKADDEIIKLNSEIGENGEYEDKLRRDEIINIKIQIEQDKMIVDYLDSKLHGKITKCAKLEE